MCNEIFLDIFKDKDADLTNKENGMCFYAISSCNNELRLSFASFFVASALFLTRSRRCCHTKGDDMQY